MLTPHACHACRCASLFGARFFNTIRRKLHLSCCCSACKCAASYLQVLYTPSVLLAVGLPAAQSAGFFVTISPALIGSGVFTGLRNSATMFLSAVLVYGVLGPAFVCTGSNVPYKLESLFAGCVNGGYMSNIVVSAARLLWHCGVLLLPHCPICILHPSHMSMAF